MLIIFTTMYINIWKTVCSVKNVPVLLKFCLGYYLILRKALRLVLLIKNLDTKHVRILTSTEIKVIFS